MVAVEVVRTVEEFAFITRRLKITTYARRINHNSRAQIWLREKSRACFGESLAGTGSSELKRDGFQVVGAKIVVVVVVVGGRATSLATN